MASSALERFGEFTLGFLERIYVFILDLLIMVAPFLSKALERIQRFDRERIYPFFERRDIEIKDYTIFKLQITSSLFLIISTLFIINYISFRKFWILGGLLIILSTYLLAFPVKREFKEFSAYRDFFLSFFILLIVLVAIKIRQPFVIGGAFFTRFTGTAVIGVGLIFLYFRSKHSRDFTFGKVLDDDGIDVKVKLNYDILSNVKPQIVILRNKVGAKDGDIVKIRVNRGFLSIKGSIPIEVLGVEKT
jgi:uncharacterized membrane protein